MTEPLALLRLGPLPWLETQLVYHTLAREHLEAVVTCSSKERYVCVGYHQDLAAEVEIDYCTANGIGLFRREPGGGAVLLEPAQAFYQVIVDRHREGLPRRHDLLYEVVLQPVCDALRSFGVDARFAPICDLLVGERKISGNAGGEVGDCRVVIGNVLLDFDRSLMAHVLRCPSEEFRRRFAELLRQQIVTLDELCPRPPSLRMVEERLSQAFDQRLGPLEPRVWTRELQQRLEGFAPEYTDAAWLLRPDSRRGTGRRVKVREGLYLCQDDPAAPERLWEERPPVGRDDTTRMGDQS